MIRCTAIDKDAFFLQILADLIKYIPELHLLGTYQDVESAVSEFKNNQLVADLIFLDLQTIDRSRISLADALPEGSRIIITSNHPHYNLEGYTLEIIDQLIKPFTLKRVKRAVRKLIALLDSELAYETPHFTQLLTPNAEDFIFLQHLDRINKIWLYDICYFEGHDAYVTIHTTVGKIVVLEKLEKLAELVRPYKFIAISSTIIISVKYLDLVDGNFTRLYTYELPIEEAYKTELFKFLE